MSSYMRSIIVGNVTENADLYCGSSKVTNYGQHVVASSYQFHGKRGSLTNGCAYRTIITFAFRHNQGGGGTGTLTAMELGHHLGVTQTHHRRPGAAVSCPASAQPILWQS
ncbi:hypothetical protein [Micromonospora lupini]|uniref:hypothetical protein n=1 Tax=Micromonospora lupini TaxID=285679 RepID=UPI0031DD4333